MRKYVSHLYNYIIHVYAGRPGGYPEAFLNKKKRKKEMERCDGHGGGVRECRKVRQLTVGVTVDRDV